MADERKVIYIEINASKAVDGSSAATRALAAIEKSTASMDGALSKMEASLGRVGGYLKAQLALMLTDVAGRLFQMAKDSLNAAANLGELADQLGITAKGLQALQFASVQYNVKLEQLETGVGKFSQKIGEAAGGSKQMIDALNAIGVKILDTQGKLRPTEELMQNVAAAIMAIDDPAKRAAAAVDFFGKAGTRMLPLLPEIAKGMDAMAESARRAGAMISDEAIAKLDKLADSGERTKLVMRAMFAENAAGPLTEVLDFISRKIENLSTLIKEAASNLTSLLAAAANPIAFMSRMVGSTPAEKLASDIEAQQKAIAGSEAALANLGANDIRRQYTQSSLDRARETLAALQRQQGVMAVGGRSSALPADPDNIGILVAQRPGASNPKPTGGGGGGETPEQKYAKLTVRLQETARAQDLMTAAARAGDVAFAEQQVHLDAVQKTLEIFGKRLADNDPLLVELEARLLRISRGKAAEAFNVATTELEKQNVILSKQIELMDAAPEIQAREIALIKAKNEAEKAGSALTSEDIENRRVAIEQNETLKSQAEELKRANELWTAPLKSALESIQQTAADAFEGMLESGKFSFDSLKDIFTKTLRRMAAEFLALATIRPVMSILVNAVSPQMARQMGLGSSTGSAMSTSGGGGLLGNLFGGGGIGEWLSSPISFGGALNTSASSPASFMAPAGATGATLGGITWGQGLGALAGAGMGAYQLLAGGGSTASTIGGIASLVGAGVSLIPGIGQIAGPLIALAGGLLPGLFGGTPEPPTNRSISSLNFSGGAFRQSGGSYGMDAADLGGLGSSLKSLLDAAKVNLTSSAYGLQQQQFSKGDFANATTFITGPGGGQMQWGQSSDPAQQQQALDTAAAHVAHQIMLEVGSGISDVMREGLANFGLQNLQRAFSMEELGTAVAKLNMLDAAFASFGKTTTEAEAAIKAVDEGFNELFNIAAEFNISAGEVAKIEAERNKQRLKVTEDFSGGIDQMLMEMKNPLQAALDANEKARVKDIVNNDEFLRLVEGYGDKRLQIEELYALRRQEIIENANAATLAAQQQAAAAQRQVANDLVSAVAGSVSRVQDLIRELSPGGALSNLDPAGQLAGLRASASASLAQAFANPSDTSLIDRAVSDQRAFLEFNRSFSGGSTAFVRDQQAALSQLQALQGASTQGAIGGAGDPAVRNLLQRLLTAVQQSNDNSADRDAVVNEVMGLLRRFLANQAA